MGSRQHRDSSKEKPVTKSYINTFLASWSILNIFPLGFFLFHILTATIVPHCSYRRGETMSLNCGQYSAYSSSRRWYLSLESHGGMIFREGNLETRRESCPSATLTTTNPTSTWPGRVRGGKPNRLSHRTPTHDNYSLKFQQFILIAEYITKENANFRPCSVRCL
jgi:hypothetical protein